MYIGLHNHTAVGSNTRGFLDSINRVEDMIEYAKELGMPGFCITDHDSLTAHIDLLHYVKNKRKEDNAWENFKPICGNEIYLTSREKIEVDKDYSSLFHFILIAKDIEGYQQLRDLSTKAWVENFFTFVNPRTPTYFNDLFECLEKNPGHLIGSTACLGGQLDRLILEEKDSGNFSSAEKFLLKMQEKFGEGNFFMEMQPSNQEDQIFVNNIILQLSKKLNIPYIITTDAHYLKKEDREVHKYFLLSDENGSSTREVDDFYESTYIMSEDEIHEYMDQHIGRDAVNVGLLNTLKVFEACEEYSLDKPLNIPYKAFDMTEPDAVLYAKFVSRVPLLKYFYESKHLSDRHMCRELLNKIENNPEEFQNQETYDALQDCLNALIVSSEAQHTQWSGYLLVCKELIKTVWESGSLCGAGRGSGVGFLILYMLDITQINPLKESVKTYYWRFLHEKRASVLDIDFDSEGSKKDAIIENLRNKYGGYNHVTKVQTISTAKSKRALQIAARGLGYTPEEGTYMASFIKAERGILYTLSQTYYGDVDNNINPDIEFRKLMDDKYPDVWAVAQKIEGLPVGCGSHAGGLILSIDNLSNSCPLMRTRSGDVITQVDLHRAEDMGLIKYDVLNIDALEKIHYELDLLLEDGRIEWQGTLKDTYEKYLGVYNIERDNPAIWDMIDNHEIISLFQFEKQTGWACIEAGKPRSLGEMSALNSVMRLMPPDPNAETPLQRYSRFNKDISLWYDEMTEYGLTKEEQDFVKKYAARNYGLLANQEDFMSIVRDPMVGGFDLLWSDRLRKSIAKKNPKEYMTLQSEFYDNMRNNNLSEKLCHYVWDVLISMNRGYGFNLSHTLAYSIIALQEANLAYHFPVIYWNCANLINDSGGIDGNVNYGKNAAAIGRMRKEGIKIVPPYINEARFGFKPDVENNEIVYGIKAISGIGANVAKAIVDNQPYTSMLDFYDKMSKIKGDADFTFGDTAMVQLIKAGAFDLIEHKPRKEIMKDYCKIISNPLKSLSINNIEDLNNLGLLSKEEKAFELRYYRFRNYVFQKKNLKKQAGKSPSTGFYLLEPKYALPYFNENFDSDMDQEKDYMYIDGYTCVKRGSFDRVFDKKMEKFKSTTLSDPDNLKKVNDARAEVVWKERGEGTVSKWEMDSLFFYYGPHELARVNKNKYNLSNFDELSDEPQIVDTYFYNGKSKPRYNLSQIAGTVIDKDKNHNTVTLLTPDGVVVVKFYKGQFGFYDREISKINEDGTKTKIEKSWFKRGTKLIVTGFRSEEYFIPRKYSDSIYNHTVRLIKEITPDNELVIQTERAGEEGDKAIAV